MSTINERLKLFLDKKQIKQSEFSEKLKSNQPYISSLLSGSRNLGTNLTNRILKQYPDLDRVWFLTGDGQMMNNQKEKHTEVKPSTKKKSKNSKYPIIKDINNIPEEFQKWVKPFYPEMKIDVGFELEFYRQPTKYFLLVPYSEKVEFWVEVQGHSMFPKYANKDLIGLSKTTINDIFWGNNCVVSYKKGVEAHLKRIEKGTTDKTIILRSYNPENADKEVPIDILESFFKVRMHIGIE